MKYAVLALGVGLGLTFLGRPNDDVEDAMVFDTEEEATEALAEWKEEYDTPGVTTEIVAFESHLQADTEEAWSQAIEKAYRQAREAWLQAKEAWRQANAAMRESRESLRR